MSTSSQSDKSRRQSGRAGWVLLWALGVPIPVMFVLFMLRSTVAAAPPVATDEAALCAPYGGVREVASRTYTIRSGVEETGLAVYCKDGSYVARHTTGKP
jgi:hypothetical protein